MPIDPELRFGGEPDPTIPPFTADHTPDPGSSTSITGDFDATIPPGPATPRAVHSHVEPDQTIAPPVDSNRAIAPLRDSDQTVAPASLDPDRTLAPVSLDPGQTVPPRLLDADRTIAPGANDDATVGPAPADQEDRTFAPGAPPVAEEGMLAPGTKLGTRYTILKLLGRGGMGAVYQAYDDELGVAVAIKTILPGEGSDEYTRRDQVTRFKSELLLARQVTHKNVVRIHDLGGLRRLKYITMSYVSRRDADRAHQARSAPLPVPQALSAGAPNRRRHGGGARSGRRAPRPQARERHRHAATARR